MSNTTKEQREFVRDSYIESPESIALNLLDDLEAAEEEVQRLQSAISWALGEGDDFPLRTEDDGPFYWRRELRQRARGKTQAQESESE